MYLQLQGTTSWRVAVDRGNPLIDAALWIRAAEAIEVPPDPFVPGPLDDPPAPEPTATGLGAAWLAWWRDLIGMPPWTFEQPDAPPPELDLDSPDALGLARWPELREVVMRRWPQAGEWHRARGERHRRTEPSPSPVVSIVAAEVERELGRRLRPFRLDLVLLPVRDTTVRQVNEERHLVPERVYDGLRGTRWLTDLLHRVG